MTDDMVSREALHELLFDGVAPPAGSDAMFAQTFATDGSDGADLLPPDGLFDIPADADDDEQALDDLDPADLDPTDPSSDEYASDDVAPAVDDHAAPGHDVADDTAHDATDPAADHGHHDPGTGW